MMLKMYLKLSICVSLILALSSCLVAEIVLLNSLTVTKFEVSGNALKMTDIINSKTPKQLNRLLAENSNINELVLLDVPGSVDDEANLKMATMIRERGLNTRLLADSVVASGGTDLFLAGVKRYAAHGSQMGVHTWQASDGTVGGDLPRSHENHQAYLEYYRKMGIPEGFYWFTLSAASADEIHWMSEEEITKYRLVTELH